MEVILKLIKGFVNFFLLVLLVYVFGKDGSLQILGRGVPINEISSIYRIGIFLSFVFISLEIVFSSVQLDQAFKYTSMLGLGLAGYVSGLSVFDLMQRGDNFLTLQYSATHFLIIAGVILNLGIEAVLYIYFTPDIFVENTIPVLSVKDLPASVAFYRDVLGFRVEWGDEEESTVASVSCDGHAIMLRQVPADGWQAGTAWIGMEDDTFFEEWEVAGATVLQPAKQQAWAYDMKFADLDGNVLWLATG